MDDQAGIQVISDANPQNSDEPSGIEQKKTEIIEILAQVGKTLHQTYSEENQNTASGFIDAQNMLQQLKSDLQLHDLLWTHPATEAGLVDLINYLEEKLEKRTKAVDKNAYNM
ncbi:MAG: hypothetical protein ACOCXP_01710 [Candidatus Dojkabacteria bacterium]